MAPRGSSASRGRRGSTMKVATRSLTPASMSSVPSRPTSPGSGSLSARPGGGAGPPGLGPGLHAVPRHHERAPPRDRDREHERAAEQLRQPGRHRPRQGEQDEGADAADADLPREALALLPLDPDEGADQEGGGEAPEKLSVRGREPQGSVSASTFAACSSRNRRSCSPRSGRGAARMGTPNNPAAVR